MQRTDPNRQNAIHATSRSASGILELLEPPHISTEVQCQHQSPLSSARSPSLLWTLTRFHQEGRISPSPTHLQLHSPLRFTDINKMSGDTCHRQLGTGTKISAALSSVAAQPRKPTAALFLPSHAANNTSNLLSAVLLRSFATLLISRSFPPMHLSGLDGDGAILQFLPRAFMKRCCLPLKSSLLGSTPKAAVFQGPGS